MGEFQVGSVRVNVYQGDDGWYYKIDGEEFGPCKGHDDARYQAILRARFVNEARKLTQEGWKITETGDPHVPVLFTKGSRTRQLIEKDGRWNIQEVN